MEIWFVSNDVILIRCVDSGLWVPGGGKKNEETEDGLEEEYDTIEEPDEDKNSANDNSTPVWSYCEWFLFIFNPNASSAKKSFLFQRAHTISML